MFPKRRRQLNQFGHVQDQSIQTEANPRNIANFNNSRRMQRQANFNNRSMPQQYSNSNYQQQPVSVNNNPFNALFRSRQQQPLENYPTLNNARNLVAGSNISQSAVQNIASPAKLNSFINGTQQVIKTAQSLQPIVSQYVPMIKNIPAMWSIYRGIQDDSSNENSKEKQPVNKKNNDRQNKFNNLMNFKNKQEHVPEKEAKAEKIPEVSNSEVKLNKKRNTSGPKLYI